MQVINAVDSCLHESKFSRVRRVKCGEVGAGERTAFTAKIKKRKVARFGNLLEKPLQHVITLPFPEQCSMIS